MSLGARRALPVVVAVGCLTVEAASSPPAVAALSDPLAADQWGLRAINAAAANAVSDGGGVLVAVLDTGVEREHPDLAGNVVDGPDFVGGDSEPEDDNGHGTHVAGIIAAHGNNGVGGRGAAPGVTVLNIRVLDSAAAGSTDTVARGVDKAVAEGAKVINLSLAVVADLDDVLRSVALTLALSRATAAGVTVVAAAGNKRIPLCAQPIVVPQLICVGAVDQRLKRSSFSNYGVRVDLVAPGGGLPGEGILSTIPAGGYGTRTGTSQAAAFVSATAAMLVGLGLSREQILGRLLSTTRDLGAPGYDFDHGHGLLDAAAAVSGLQSTMPARREARAVQRGRSTFRAQTFLRRGLRVRCLLPPPGSCSARLTIRGVTVGRGSAWVRDSHGVVVKVAPTRSGRRYLRRVSRDQRARLTVGNSHVEPSTRTIRIRR